MATATATTPRVVRECTLEWIKFDAMVARDGSLNPTAKALYAALSTFADSSTRGTDPDPNGFDVPDRKTLAACVGVSVDTIDRQTSVLEEYEFPDGTPLLTVQRRKDPQNPRSNLPNVYILNDPEHWDYRAAQRHANKTGGRTDAARGGRTDAARGGRTDAARGGRTDAAVPLSSPEDIHTPRAREESTTVEPEPEGVCVYTKNINDDTDSAVVDEGLDAARRGLNATARKKLTGTQQSKARTAVASAMKRGCTTTQIMRAVAAEHTDDKTTHPGSAIVRAIEGLEPDSPADIPAPRTTEPIQADGHRDAAADNAALMELARRIPTASTSDNIDDSPAQPFLNVSDRPTGQKSNGSRLAAALARVASETA